MIVDRSHPPAYNQDVSRRWWTISVAVSLLLGAVINVAVAWRLAATADWGVLRSNARSNAGSYGQTRASQPAWLVWSWGGSGWTRLCSAAVLEDFDGKIPPGLPSVEAPSWSRAHRPPSEELPQARRMMLEDARGWPMRSLLFRATLEKDWDFIPPPRRISDDDFRTRTIGDFDGAIVLEDWPQPRGWSGRVWPPDWGWIRALPLIPIWPGFVANTVTYATPVWLVIACVTLIRHRSKRSRMKRGLCPRCAYDLRHALDLGCPECGWNR